MAHVHSHDHDHSYGPASAQSPADARRADHSHIHHNHGPHGRHLAQLSPWSILRMSVPGRLAAALVVSAALWAVVLLAMRPS